MRILVVEDEGAIARPLVRLLGQAHHRVVWAQSLEEAWTAMEEGEPDLLVLDVMLPEGEEAGFAFAQAVREGGYSGPILFLTARDALEDRVRGLDLGGDDYLAKPFHLEDPPFGYSAAYSRHRPEHLTDPQAPRRKHLRHQG
ncbi:response regulator, partial [Thermus sp.]|uniref:response regulator transcription factor n=1 Tax=Thermus sp. TaxID=275 RepID=UPI00307D1956